MVHGQCWVRVCGMLECELAMLLLLSMGVWYGGGCMGLCEQCWICSTVLTCTKDELCCEIVGFDSHLLGVNVQVEGFVVCTVGKVAKDNLIWFLNAPSQHALAENLFNFDVAFLMLIVHNNVCAKSICMVVTHCLKWFCYIAYISYAWTFSSDVRMALLYFLWWR